MKRLGSLQLNGGFHAWSLIIAKPSQARCIEALFPIYDAGYYRMQRGYNTSLNEITEKICPFTELKTCCGGARGTPHNGGSEGGTKRHSTEGGPEDSTGSKKELLFYKGGTTTGKFLKKS